MESSRIAEVADALVQLFADVPSCAIAFSGGVDSAVVAKAAQLALGDRAVAMTAISPSLSRLERETAARVANEIGIRHHGIDTDEMTNAEYRANRGDRCYHCKTALYQTMQAVVQQAGSMVIASGTNTDDLGDYRPGLKAAEEGQVWSPLVDLQLGKDDVRKLARYWGLSVADKPASPCLASRVAYGVEVNETRLRRVEAAETLVRSAGFHVVRVRCLAGDAASVEVEPELVEQLRDWFEKSSLERQLLKLGFTSVRIEPDGYRSGRLNDVLVPLSLDKLPGHAANRSEPLKD